MDIKVYHELTPQLCDSIDEIKRIIFPSTYRSGHIKKEWSSKKNLLALLGYIDHELVAFKIGYELRSETFYSWVGGVLPAYRNKGLAKQLMHKQHEILTERAYKKVRTKTRMSYRPMLILNLTHGFDITGVSTKPGVPGLILQMDKPLTASH